MINVNIGTTGEFPDNRVRLFRASQNQDSEVSGSIRGTPFSKSVWEHDQLSH